MLRDRFSWLAFVLLVTASIAACSEGTPGTSTPTTPGASASVTGTWAGTARDNGGSGNMTWVLTQSGDSFAGTFTSTNADPANAGVTVTGRGSITGSVSGNSFNFALTVPPGGYDGGYGTCTVSVSGSGTASANNLSGTYGGSGSSCPVSTISSGEFSLNKQ